MSEPKSVEERLEALEFYVAALRFDKRASQLDWAGQAMVALFVALIACVALSVCAVSAHWALSTWGIVQ